MLVENVMCRRAASVSFDDSAQRALSVARSSKVHHLVVVERHECVGLVTLCELERVGPSQPVGKLACPPLFTLEPEDPVSLAVRAIGVCGTGCVVVADRWGRVKGLLTRTDLIRAGALSGTPGLHRCVACESAEHLIVDQLGGPSMCCGCFDAVRKSEVALSAPVISAWR